MRCLPRKKEKLEESVVEVSGAERTNGQGVSYQTLLQVDLRSRKVSQLPYRCRDMSLLQSVTDDCLVYLQLLGCNPG